MVYQTRDKDCLQVRETVSLASVRVKDIWVYRSVGFQTALSRDDIAIAYETEYQRKIENVGTHEYIIF